MISFRSLLLATLVLGTAGLTGRLGLLLGVVGLDNPGLELALECMDEEEWCTVVRG